MSTTLTVLAIIGLVVGLVVLLVVIKLLHGTLAPLLAVQADVKSAKTAPMLERGVPGTDQLDQTRRLADGVPDLAVRYLQKLSLGVNTEPPAPYAAAPPPPPPPTPAQPAPPGKPDSTWAPPAWHRYRS
jgi:hypothetical protein